MGLLFYLWSRVANSNSNSDSAINWAEGQAPSSVNDSARAMMASTAAFRDDIAGAIVTGGTSTAYTVTSYQVFDTLAHMNGALIAFTPHTANGATVTLNVDGLGAKPLRTSTGVELQTNVLIAGTPYMATYNNSDAVWYLHGLGGNAYGVPLAAGMDYWGATAPSSAFAFPTGQAISRTTYASLYALVGNTYGAGNGTTTFNLPNKSGRISAAIDLTGTVLTSASITNGAGPAALGGTGGTEGHTLTQAQLSVALGTASTSILNGAGLPAGAGNTVAGAGSAVSVLTNASSFVNVTATTTITNASGGNPHNNVQPTIMCNYIMRII